MRRPSPKVLGTHGSEESTKETEGVEVTSGLITGAREQEILDSNKILRNTGLICGHQSLRMRAKYTLFLEPPGSI